MKPKQRATVYTRLERNTTQREIARITGIDRKTIRSYQRRWESEHSARFALFDQTWHSSSHEWLREPTF